MQIIPKDSPHAITAPIQTGPTPSQQAAKARAIAMLTGTQGSNQTPDNVSVNPSKMSAEDMTIIKKNDQPDNNVEASSSQVSEEVSTPPAQEAAPEKPAEPLSNQYAVLARKEKAARAKALELQQREMMLKAREEALKPQVDTSKYVDRSLLSDPQKAIKVLEENGLSYDQLTEAILNQASSQTPEAQIIQKLQARIDQLEEGLNKTNKSYEEQQKQQYDQAVSQIRNEVVQLINRNPDDFEAIRATRSVDDVVDLIKQTFEKDQILMTPEEAAQEIEEYLAEEAYRLSQLKKIQSRYRSQVAPATAGAKPAAPSNQPQKQPMKTLTNSVGSTRKLTARERAIAVFKGEKIS